MKRFFCNTCQRIKRVYRLPANVHPVYGTDRNGNQVVASYTAGDCTYHTAKLSNRELRYNARKPSAPITKKQAPPPPPPKSKRR